MGYPSAWILSILFLIAVFGELIFFGEVIKPKYFSGNIPDESCVIGEVD